MVTSLRQRIALAVLIGVMAIPLVMSSLGGIGQLLVCEAVVEQPFAVAPGDSGPIVASARSLERDAPPPTDGDACGGVTTEIAAELVEADTVRLVVTIVNTTDQRWRGTIGLAAAAQDVDVDLTTSLGEVPAGQRRSDDVLLRVQDAQTDIAGRLLLGP